MVKGKPVRGMKEIKLEDIKKRNAERKEEALSTVKKYYKDFHKGKREDRYYGRKDKEKGRILEEMGKREEEIQN